MISLRRGNRIDFEDEPEGVGGNYNGRYQIRERWLELWGTWGVVWNPSAVEIMRVILVKTPRNGVYRV